MWWSNMIVCAGHRPLLRHPMACTGLVAAVLTICGARPVSASPAGTQPPLYGAPGQPDIAGVWHAERNGAPPGFGGRSDRTPAGNRDASGSAPPVWGTTPPPLTPGYAARYRTITQAANAGNPLSDTVSECKALGAAFLESGPGDMEIIQTPGEITMIQESGHEVRRIHTDGRTPDPDPDPAYDGYNIGQWHGRTLQIDVTGLRPETPMDTTDTPHSDALKMTERWTLVTPDIIRVDTVATDAKAFTHAWLATHWWSRAPAGEELAEQVCEDNNRNPANADGSQGFTAPH